MVAAFLMALSDIYNFYRLDTARITLAAEQGLVLVEETLENLDRLSKKDAALEQNVVARHHFVRGQKILQHTLVLAKDAREVELAWEKQEDDDGWYHPDLKAVDNKMDRLIYALSGSLETQIKVMEPGEADLAAAQLLFKDLFPHGAAKVAQSSFVKEMQEVKRIVEETEKQAELVARLGLSGLVARIAALAPEYERLLKAPRPEPGIKHEAVMAALDLANDRLLHYVSVIMGLYGDAEGEALRNHYLGPVLRENEATAAEKKLGPRKKK